MTLLRVVNADRGTSLGSRVRLVDRWLGRLRGLLGSPEPGAGEGLMLTPCRSIHMLGMRFPIDVAFLDRDRRVVAIRPRLAPGLRAAAAPSAHYALELPAGTLEATGTVPGDRLDWSSQEAAP